MKNVVSYTRTQRVGCSPQDAFRPIQRIGGRNGWYFGNWLWRLRGWMDRGVGGPGLRRDQRAPGPLEPGDIIDFWRVDAFEPGRLLRLVAEAKMPGRGWLQFDVEGAKTGSSVRLLALFEPAGWLGYLYWYALYPVHWLMFRGTLRALAREMGECGPLGSGAASGPRADELSDEPRLVSSR